MASHHHDIIHNYIVAQLASVEKYLKEYFIGRDAEHIHELRVSIKKLRAIYYFTASDKVGKQCDKFLKPLFQDAGALRIYEICLSIGIVQSNANPQLMNQLKSSKQELSALFCRNIQQYEKSIMHFRDHFDHNLALPDTIEIAGYFLRQKIKAIERFDTQKRDGLHKFRQIIKDLKYVYDIIPFKIQQRIYLDKTLIDKLQKAIGEWHDTYSTLNLLVKHNFSGSEKCIQKLKQVEYHQFESVFNRYFNINL